MQLGSERLKFFSEKEDHMKYLLLAFLTLPAAYAADSKYDERFPVMRTTKEANEDRQEQQDRRGNDSDRPRSEQPKNMDPDLDAIDDEYNDDSREGALD
jgi:hypothetical protein